jgi:hypothetical protein
MPPSPNGIRHIHTKPDTSGAKGKAESEAFIRILPITRISHAAGSYV